jgi:SPOR domain
MGILVIAGVFALAVIGTAGAFGYRALFGTSSSSLPPPVIKADTAPSKIVPAANLDTQSSKQITDRLNDRGIGENLVSREEQPVAVSPQSQDANQSSGPAPIGSGIVGSEPKKVRTIAIRPDQSTSPDAAPPSPPPAPPPARVANVTPAKLAATPSRVVTTAPPAAEDAEPAPAPRPPVVRAAQPVQAAAAPARGNAPLSLSPDAPTRAAPARAAAAPARTAAVTPAQTAPVAAGGSYAVQVSAQRSEAEAQAAFRSLQGKYPIQLGGKQPVIRQVDLGEKGVFYRAMVPAGSSGEATELCNGLKAAGGSCIIQRN